jgi:hypothetical protein
VRPLSVCTALWNMLLCFNNLQFFILLETKLFVYNILNKKKKGSKLTIRHSSLPVMLLMSIMNCTVKQSWIILLIHVLFNILYAYTVYYLFSVLSVLVYGELWQWWWWLHRIKIFLFNRICSFWCNLYHWVYMCSDAWSIIISPTSNSVWNCPKQIRHKAPLLQQVASVTSSSQYIWPPFLPTEMLLVSKWTEYIYL